MLPPPLARCRPLAPAGKEPPIGSTVPAGRTFVSPGWPSYIRACLTVSQVFPTFASQEGPKVGLRTRFACQNAPVESACSSSRIPVARESATAPTSRDPAPSIKPLDPKFLSARRVFQAPSLYAVLSPCRLRPFFVLCFLSFFFLFFSFSLSFACRCTRPAKSYGAVHAPPLHSLTPFLL